MSVEPSSQLAVSKKCYLDLAKTARDGQLRFGHLFLFLGGFRFVVAFFCLDTSQN